MLRPFPVGAGVFMDAVCETVWPAIVYGKTKG
jgi:hypothetical protein